MGIFPWGRRPDPTPQSDKDLAKVREMFSRLEHHSFWMPRPESWVWARPGDGQPQGFGLLARQSPGLCNLLWLSMEMDRPPAVYDAMENGLYMLIMLQGQKARLLGEPLLDVAGLMTLVQFEQALPAEAGFGLATAYPLLKLLAKRRLPC
jgi:hypothetical protein